MRFAYAIAWLAMGFLPLPAMAVEDFKATPAEFKMLPEWCEIKQNDWARYTRDWMARLGGRDNALHLHHYCDCLRFQNRAYSSRTKYDRDYNLQIAIGGCDYVLTHALPDFFMRAEILTEKARGLHALGQDAKAAQSLMVAIDFDPKYARAYSQLGDLFAGMGNRAKALQIVSDGLRHVPDSKALQRIYSRLGGKQPYPEPIPAAKPADTVSASPQAEEKPTAKSSPQPVGDASAVPGSPPPAPTATGAEPPKIGSPKNPYCRFCVD